MSRNMLAVFLAAALSTALSAQKRRAPIDVQHYAITAAVEPGAQSLNAVVQVRFVPSEDNLSSASFELNNALNVSRVVDQQGQALQHRRPPEATLRSGRPNRLRLPADRLDQPRDVHIHTAGGLQVLGRRPSEVVSGLVHVRKEDEHEAGIVLPHEKTLSKAKEDRFKLFKATNSNFSQIFGLYPDPEQQTGLLLDQAIAGRTPLIEFLRQKSRPYTFSNTVPPSVVMGSIEAINLIENENVSGVRKYLERFENEARSLGIECKVGIAQRAERIVGLGGASLLVGAGPHALVIEVIVALLAAASIITVVQRFIYVHRHAEGRAPEMVVRVVEPAPKQRALDSLAKGS